MLRVNTKWQYYLSVKDVISESGADILSYLPEVDAFCENGADKIIYLPEVDAFSENEADTTNISF